jgi:hypothetical protein
LHVVSADLGQRSLVWLRNPGATSMPVALSVGDAFRAGPVPTARLAAVLAYPRRERLVLLDDGIALRLEPFECALVEFGPAAELEALASDWPVHDRAPLLQREGGEDWNGVVRYRGKAAATVRLLVATHATAGAFVAPRLLRDGRPLTVAPAPARGGIEWTTVPVHPDERLDLALEPALDSPFPASGRFALWAQAIGEVPARVGPAIDGGARLPPLPPASAMTDGLLVADMRRQHYASPALHTPSVSEVASEARVRFDVMGSEGGPLADKWLLCGERPIARVPDNPGEDVDTWSTVELQVTGEALAQLELARRGDSSLTLRFTNGARDEWKVRNVQLALRFGGAGWLLTQTDPRTLVSDIAWKHATMGDIAFVNGRSVGIVLKLEQ